MAIDPREYVIIHFDEGVDKTLEGALKHDRVDVVVYPFLGLTVGDIRHQLSRLNCIWYAALRHDAPKTILGFVSLYSTVGLALPPDSVDVAWEYGSFQSLVVLHEHTEFRTLTTEALLRRPSMIPAFCDVYKNFEWGEKFLLACRGNQLGVVKQEYKPEAKINQQAMVEALKFGSDDVFLFFFEHGHELSESSGSLLMEQAAPKEKLRPVLEHYVKKLPEHMLSCAITHKNPEMGKECLAQGAVVTAPMMVCAALGDFPDMGLLLSNGGVVTPPVLINALHNPKTFRALLDWGAEPGQDELQHAIYRGYPETVQLILEAGVVPTKENLEMAIAVRVQALLRQHLPTIWDHLEA